MTERSTAIVLFTDLVGSTELRSRVGEDAADGLRHQHDALVAGAVEAHRGTVVKNLGDGIMATFAGASDAVSAAVAIQQAIDRHNRSSTAALEVRIGISAGDVVFERDDCFGTPVIEAARLCAAAQGGQILVSEIVRWMARSGGSTFTPVGALELKGLPEPVPTVEVGWEPLAQSSVPLPSFLTDIGRIFVGRDGDLDRLDQLWKEAAAGELRVALVGGEPGVGKTALGRRTGPQAPRGRRHGPGRPLRRRPRRAVPAVRRGAAPLRRPQLRCWRTGSVATAGNCPPRAGVDRTSTGAPGTAAVRPRDRALPALRRRGRLADRRLDRRARAARARRPPVGGQTNAAAAPSRRTGRKRSCPHPRHLSGHRTHPRPSPRRGRRRTSAARAAWSGWRSAASMTSALHRSSSRPPVVPSTKPATPWPGPSTRRRRAIPSSSARCCATSLRPA